MSCWAGIDVSYLPYSQRHRIRSIANSGGWYPLWCWWGCQTRTPRGNQCSSRVRHTTRWWPGDTSPSTLIVPRISVLLPVSGRTHKGIPLGGDSEDSFLWSSYCTGSGVASALVVKESANPVPAYCSVSHFTWEWIAIFHLCSSWYCNNSLFHLEKILLAIWVSFSKLVVEPTKTPDPMV